MKTLILIRHAKSDKETPIASDFERGLAERGKKEAKEMGKTLKKLQFETDFIICSSATRAILTLEWLIKQYEHLKEIPSIFVQEIYDYHMGGTRKTMDLIKWINDEVTSLTLIGHNPCFEELFADFLSVSWFSYPTLWITQIDFDVDSWKDVKYGTLKMFIAPSK